MTSMSVCASTNLRKPSATMPWSSAISTLIFTSARNAHDRISGRRRRQEKPDTICQSCATVCACPQSYSLVRTRSAYCTGALPGISLPDVALLVGRSRGTLSRRICALSTTRHSADPILSARRDSRAGPLLNGYYFAPLTAMVGALEDAACPSDRPRY